jgi:hypothetical protein
MDSARLREASPIPHPNVTPLTLPTRTAQSPRNVGHRYAPTTQLNVLTGAVPAGASANNLPL